MIKFNILLYFFLSLPISLLAQSAPINPSQVIIGSATSTMPTPLPGEYQVPLVIYNNSNSGWFSPALTLGSPNGRLSISLANENGAYNVNALKGDVIFRTVSTPAKAKVIFDLAGDETTERKFYFGRSANIKTLVVASNNKVGINTDNLPNDGSNFRLYVRGGIKAEEVKVELCNGWCDYVFDKNYALMSLPKVAKYITENGHLPNIPSSKALEAAEGFSLGEMARLQQEKIEELYLHAIEMHQKLTDLTAKMEKLEQENQTLKNK